MPTPIEQIQIDFLIDLIKQGKSHGECLAQFGTKWNKSKNTFERRWNIANKQFKELQNSIEKEKIEQYKQSEINQNKAVILQREKALEMVSNVAKIQYNKIVAKDSKANSSDVMAFNGTIERLAKFDGWDEAIKNEHKVFKTEDIIFKIKRTDDTV